MATSETDLNRDDEARRYAEREIMDDRDPHAIERNIDATRADMRATLEALERRFSFDRLLDLTVGRIRERGGEFAGNLTDAATQNPMPLVLTSIGLAWMMLASRSGGTRAYSGTHASMAGARERMAGATDTMRSAADSTRDTLQQAAESSREAFRHATQSSRETFEHTAESLRGGAESLRSGARTAAAATREQVEHARARMDRMLDEQPLMLGAFGLAVGAVIGALLPATEHENRLLGDVRDKAVRDVARSSRARFEAAREHAAAAVSAAAAPPSSGGDTAGERPTSRPH